MNTSGILFGSGERCIHAVVQRVENSFLKKIILTFTLFTLYLRCNSSTTHEDLTYTWPPLGIKLDMSSARVLAAISMALQDCTTNYQLYSTNTILTFFRWSTCRWDEDLGSNDFLLGPSLTHLVIKGVRFLLLSYKYTPIYTILSMKKNFFS